MELTISMSYLNTKKVMIQRIAWKPPKWHKQDQMQLGIKLHFDKYPISKAKRQVERAGMECKQARYIVTQNNT